MQLPATSPASSCKGWEAPFPQSCAKLHLMETSWGKGKLRRVSIITFYCYSNWGYRCNQISLSSVWNPACKTCAAKSLFFLGFIVLIESMGRENTGYFSCLAGNKVRNFKLRKSPIAVSQSGRGLQHQDPQNIFWMLEKLQASLGG